MERLLISTFNQLILWDGKQNIIREGHRVKGHHKYYGITWNEKEIFVVEGGRPGATIFSLIHVYDKKLKHKRILPFGDEILDPHQAYWWDGILYVTNTTFNRIDAWDGFQTRHINWYPPDYKEHEHINSIWCDGKRFYVVEHRKTKLPKRIRIFDLGFNTLLETIKLDCFDKAKSYGIHNVYVEKGALYVCGPDGLIRVKKRVKIFCPSALAQQSHYLRGFARTKKHFFLGVSEAAVRDKRIKGDSAVLVLNNKLELIETIYLEGTGNLTEIRAVDGPDLAHNRIRCPYV